MASTLDKWFSQPAKPQIKEELKAQAPPPTPQPEPEVKVEEAPIPEVAVVKRKKRERQPYPTSRSSKPAAVILCISLIRWTTQKSRSQTL